jgi:hypothetical protein
MLSFSLNFDPVFTMASQIVNGLFGAYTVPLGITLGLGILGVIVTAFRTLSKG